MIQTTEDRSTAIVTTHAVNTELTSTSSNDQLAQYKELCDRIHICQARILQNSYDLGHALREMRESCAYEAAGYVNFHDFCQNVYNRTSRWANFLIDASVNRDNWIESSVIDAELEGEILALPESVAREISRAPRDDQPGIVKALLTSTEKPTAKRATALVQEVTVPKLETVITTWEQVGEVTRGEGEAFSVRNSTLTYIDWSFADRERAWEAWKTHGPGYLQKVTQLKINQVKEEAIAQAQSLATEAEVEIGPITQVVAEVVEEPKSCFGCVHHEHYLDGFKCSARTITMSREDDYGSGCNHYKERELSGAAEFSVGRKTWANPTQIEVPYQRELEAVKDRKSVV